MSIEKLTKAVLEHEPAPFTMIFNEILQGIHHTGALGVYCYLASKPAGWNINKTELQRNFNCGREHITTCINFLKNIGVLVVTPVRNELGQMMGWSWLLKRHIPDFSDERETRNSVMTSDGDHQAIKKDNTLERKDTHKEVEGKSVDTHAAEVETLKKYEFKPPKKLTDVHRRYIRKAIELLQSRDLTLDLYLEYLTVKCPRRLLPYISNGVERTNGFGNILRPSFITQTLTGSWED